MLPHSYIKYSYLKVHHRQKYLNTLLCKRKLLVEWMYNWTTLSDEVTCKNCLKKLEAQQQSNPMNI